MHLPTEAIAGSPLGDYLAHENTLAAFAALATHLACQIVEPPALFVLIGYTLATFLGTWTLLQSGWYSLMAASVKIGKLEVVYSATLLASIGFYRLFLHRLSRFPGPKLAALSKLYYMKHVAGGHAPAHIEELHRRYGDVVRIGPNELSVREAESIAQILGYPGKMEKGPWYLGSFAKKGQSVHALRGLQEHAHRRKYWDRAFSPKALSEYQVQVKECTDLFIQRLEDASTKGTVQMDDWCTFVAFDIMGELGFGQSFGMLESGKPHFYQTFIESAMKALAIFSEIPWVMPVLTLLPAGKEQENMYKFSMQTTMDRKHRGTGRTDVFSYLVGEDKGAETAPMNDFELDADIRTIIIAGSDTTASTLSFIFSHLLEEPRWMKALQQEVEHFRGKDLDIQELAKLPILNAVIDETLRYNTIVPNRSQRIVPSEGKVLANQAIPGGAFISIPFRAIMHDERYFDDPERWNPDRLISPQSQKNLNSKCLIPFSFGPFNCAGRHLALLELRVIVAAFAIHFDGQLAPGFDKQKFEEHVLERFTIQKEYPLTANLTVRKPTK